LEPFSLPLEIFVAALPTYAEAVAPLNSSWGKWIHPAAREQGLTVPFVALNVPTDGASSGLSQSMEQSIDPISTDFTKYLNRYNSERFLFQAPYL
jgi:hypothetical protein